MKNDKKEIVEVKNIKGELAKEIYERYFEISKRDIVQLADEKYNVQLTEGQVQYFINKNGLRKEGLIRGAVAEYVKDNYRSMTTKELSKEVSERFGLDVSIYQLRRFAKNNKLTNPAQALFNQEQEEYVRKNIHNMTSIEMTDALNEKWNLGLEAKQIQNWLSDRKIPANGGRRNRVFSRSQEEEILKYAKGRTVHQVRRMAKERYGKRMTYQNMRTWLLRRGADFRVKARDPIGTERTRRDGHVYIKVSDGEWDRKERHIWEQHHGPVPEDHVVIAIDTENRYDIENLRIASKGELIRTFREMGGFTEDAEENDARVLLSQIEVLMNKLED